MSIDNDFLDDLSMEYAVEPRFTGPRFTGPQFTVSPDLPGLPPFQRRYLNVVFFQNNAVLHVFQEGKHAVDMR